MPKALEFIRMAMRGEVPPPQGETFTTLELKINFLKPVRTGKLIATGRLVKAGRTVGLVECDVVDDEDRLIARASSTGMTLRGEQAEGR